MAIQPEQRHYLKYKALYYLYNKGYSYTNTAMELGISRVTLYRLLDEAKAEGMIKFEIVDTRNIKRLLILEDELKTRYHLSDVKLIDSSSLTGDPASKLALESARYVEFCIRSGMKIGLAWGRALRAMLNYLTPNDGIHNIDVYTLLGGESDEADLQPNVMVQKLLSFYSGNSHVINAPYICHSELLCSELRLEPSIAGILDAAQNLDLAIVGVGEKPNWDSFKNGYYHFSDSIITELISANAVGDICGNFFDIDGRICSTSISNRIVSINLDSLKTCKKVIGIANGDVKVQSILGALNGGYLNILISDTNTAEKLLDARP